MKRLILMLVLVGTGTIAAADVSPATLIGETGIRRGLVVVIGDATDLPIALAKTESVVVHLLASAAAVDDARRRIAASNLHGQVTVSAYEGGRIPLIDNLASIVMVDLDAHRKVETDELMRAVRPLGALYAKRDGKWSVRIKPRPSGVDDWPQYHYDGSMSDRSNDRLAGPPHGIQWLGGANSVSAGKMGTRVIGSLVIQIDERGIVARDAYNGLPVWRRADVVTDNRYAFLADNDRVYLAPGPSQANTLPPFMIALDLRTGRQVVEYREGVKLGWASQGITDQDFEALRRSNQNEAGAVRGRAMKTFLDVKACLADGVLLQSLGTQIVALEARTGRRLWLQSLDAHKNATEIGADKSDSAVEWHHPMIVDGQVYAVAGEPAPSWSYTHWPMGATRAIHCFDLKTGKALWRWDWPESLGEPAAAYNMTPVGDWLGLMLRTRVRVKGSPAVLFVSRDGKSHKYAADTPYGNDIGGGHSHARLLFVNGKVWVNGTTKPIGSIDLNQPGDKALWDMTYAKLPRPVGCTVTRATPNFVFGSLTTYGLKENAIQHTNAARSACDIGAIPAAGMAFVTPTQCFCAPYLPGFKAFHPRSFEGVEQMNRLETGQAKPAASSDSPGDWPMYMANPRRGNWTDTKVPKQLKQLWIIKPTQESKDDPIIAEWRDNWYTQGPATPVSIAEGAAVFAIVDRQQVAAVDASSGSERWRVTIDGRVDTSPTIRGGMVYVATRNGWVYALNRDTGEMIWRFFAAPRRDRMIAFGQLESRWPLHGSVLVEDDGTWVIAGRHNDADAGLWWWRLDATTGQPITSGRLGSDGLSTQVGVGDRSDGRQSGANTPIVSNGKQLFLSGICLEKRDGKLADRPIPREGGGPGEHQWWVDRFDFDVLIPGNQGLVFDYTQMGGYKLPYYGFTQAPVYAYKGNEFLHAGGTTTMQHRGGDRGGRRTQVTRFDKRQALMEKPHPTQKGRMQTFGADVVWTADYFESDGTGLGGLAVAGDAVLVGFSVENRDHWRARDEMPHRLRTFDFQTGRKRQDDLPLPAKPVLHGVTAGAGRVFVTCEDGSIVCFGEAP